MTNRDQEQWSQPSHLFTLRLWAEDLGNGQGEWRGQVQHVLSRETRYFRDWVTLAECLLIMLPKLTDTETRTELKE